jgi:hypothetical protein
MSIFKNICLGIIAGCAVMHVLIQLVEIKVEVEAPMGDAANRMFV